MADVASLSSASSPASSVRRSRAMQLVRQLASGGLGRTAKAAGGLLLTAPLGGGDPSAPLNALQALVSLASGGIKRVHLRLIPDPAGSASGAGSLRAEASTAPSDSQLLAWGAPLQTRALRQLAQTRALRELSQTRALRQLVQTRALHQLAQTRSVLICLC